MFYYAFLDSCRPRQSVWFVLTYPTLRCPRDVLSRTLRRPQGLGVRGTFFKNNTLVKPHRYTVDAGAKLKRLVGR